MDDPLRLEVSRLDASHRWTFCVLGHDGRILSETPKETYATRREATQAGEVALQRLISVRSGRTGNEAQLPGRDQRSV